MSSTVELASTEVKPFEEDDETCCELLKLPIYLQIIMKFNGFHSDESLASCIINEDFFSGLDLSYNDMSIVLRSMFLKDLKKHHQRSQFDLMIGHQKMISICHEACTKKFNLKCNIDYVD